MGRRSWVASGLPLDFSPQQCPGSPRNNFTCSSGESRDVDSCGERGRIERQRFMRFIATVFILRPGFRWLFHRAEPLRWSNADRSNPVPPRSGTVCEAEVAWSASAQHEDAHCHPRDAGHR